MGKATANIKNNRNCVTCKHWNGSRGSESLTPKIGDMYQYEMTEKQKCWISTRDTNASFTCVKYEPRYKK